MFFDQAKTQKHRISLPPLPPSLPEQQYNTSSRKIVKVHRKQKVIFSAPIPNSISGRPSIQNRLSRIRRQQESSLSDLIGVTSYIPIPTTTTVPRQTFDQEEEKENFFENPVQLSCEKDNVIAGNGDDAEDEDMTVQEEGRPQEEEDRMLEETRERMGKTLRKWLPKNDTLASLIPVNMLADQIVGDVDIAQEDAARKRKTINTTTVISSTTNTSKKSKSSVLHKPNVTQDLFASFLNYRNGSKKHSQENKLSKERLIQIEEEQEAIYFMTIWIEHHVEPVLKHLQKTTPPNFIEEEEEESSSSCEEFLESRSSSCSYILPFPKAPELLRLMQKMTISTAPPYDINPFSVKPKPGTNSELIVSPI